MKVKEYIEELKKLDPEKNIWQANPDYGFILPLKVPETFTELEPECYDVDESNTPKVGDYVILDLR